uniref:VP2 n=1 Tax=Norovirus GI TaxID=122928 RepID=A0A0G3Y4Q7_NORV|nr:VP2 [Norovirus GI]QPJ58784.1 VP2 [Norovirus GI]QPJ58790.1 VP2 [Norovirus GI]
MAQAVLGAIAATAAGSAVGAGIEAGTQAALQHQRYQQDLNMQSLSFQHDKEMLGLQVDASNALLQRNLATRYNLLSAAGLSSADAARMIAGAPPTKVVDWNGVRISAPTSSAITLKSGSFMSVPVMNYKTNKNVTGIDNPNYAPSGSSMVSRTSQWVESQNSLRSLDPFHRSALQTTWVTPPGSTSVSTVSSTSTIPRYFNTERLPLFANLRK